MKNKRNNWIIDDDISEEDLIVELTDEEIAEIEKRHRDFDIDD